MVAKYDKIGDMKKLIMSCVALLSAVTAAQVEVRDARTRTFVYPTRVVWDTNAIKPGAGWHARCVVEQAEKLLEPKHGQVSETYFGKSVGTKLVNGGEPAGIILDFGRELHGGLQLGMSPKGTPHSRLRIRFGESVSETFSSLGDGKHATNDHAMRDFELEVPSFGTIEVGNTGFRFVRIDLVTGGEAGFEFVRAVSLMRQMPCVGGFKSSDERLNRVFDTAVRTVHLCCQEYLWDGIKRDRLVWMGDTHPETMVILNVFGAASILPESLDYIAAVTPPDKWMNTIPTYTLWWIRNVAEWYRYTGDKTYVEKHADYLEKTFDHVLTGMNATNEWRAGVFLDWPTKHNDAAQVAGTQGLALITARETAFLANALGRKGLGDKARGLAAKLERLRPDPNGAKSAAALLALSGLAEPKGMFAQVLGRNGHAGVSTFYGYYMIEAMSAAGEHQRALDTVRDYWGAMLDAGATSFWEDFNLAWTNKCFRIDEMPVDGRKDIHGDYGEFCYPGFRHSLCHGWAGGPAAWCINHVLGIRPLDVGCNTVEVKPFLGDLEWAEGAMALPDGRAVKVRAEKRPNGTLDVQVYAPEGVKVISQGTLNPDAVKLATEQASAEVSLHGGRILSLKMKGEELLWQPKAWRLDADDWANGGMPICWPWFGKIGEDMKTIHGFAKTQMFSVRSKTVGKDRCELVLGLSPNADTKRRWPYDFDLEYRITLTDRLQLELKTTNTGARPFRLTTGFHPYFAIGDRDRTTVTGTDGMKFCDSRETTEFRFAWKGDMRLTSSFDHVFVEPRGTASHTIVDPVVGRCINIASKGAAQLVVWNPGTDEPAYGNPEPGEMGVGDWRRFVCVEPAILWRDAELTVAPGEEHRISAEISVSPMAGEMPGR